MYRVIFQFNEKPLILKYHTAEEFQTLQAMVKSAFDNGLPTVTVEHPQKPYIEISINLKNIDVIRWETPE